MSDGGGFYDMERPDPQVEEDAVRKMREAAMAHNELVKQGVEMVMKVGKRSKAEKALPAPVVRKKTAARRIEDLEEMVNRLEKRLDDLRAIASGNHGAIGARLTDLESAKGVMIGLIDVQAGRMNQFEGMYKERLEGIGEEWKRLNSTVRYASESLNEEISARFRLAGRVKALETAPSSWRERLKKRFSKREAGDVASRP